MSADAQPTAQRVSRIEVGPADAALRLLDPGESATLVFRLRNASDSPTNGAPSVEIPSGWKLLTFPEPFEMGPGEVIHRLMTVRVPASAGAGLYTVSFRVRDADGTESRAASTIEVSERAHLSIEVIDEPAFVLAGATYTLGVRLRNVGNAPVHAGLRLHSSQRFGTRALPELLHLAPGQDGSAVVTVDTRGSAAVIRRSDLDIKVFRVDSLSTVSSVLAKATSRVPVVALASAGEARTHEIPFRFTMGSSGSLDSHTNAARGSTVSLAGGGAIAAGRSTRIDVLARLSDNPRSPFNARDQYRVSLKGSWGEMHAGHNRFALSPLTQGRSLRLGAAARVNAGPVTAAAYGAAADSTLRLRREAGASLALRPWRATELSVNAVAMPDSAVLLNTARLKLDVAKTGKLDVEYGRPRTDRSSNDAAWAAGASGRPWGFAYNIRRINGGSAWIGPFRARRSDQASISTPTRYPLRLTARASMRTSQDIRDVQATDSFPGLEVRTRIMQTANVALALRDWFSIEHRTSSHEATFLGEIWRHEETAVVGRGNLRFGKWGTFTAEGTKGEGRDGSVAVPRPFIRMYARAGVHAGPHHSFVLNAQRHTNSATATSMQTERRSLGGTANLKVPILSTELRLGWWLNRGAGYSLLGSGDGDVAAWSLTQMTRDAEVVQPIPGGLWFSFRARMISSPRLPSGRRTVGAASLGITFGLPRGVANGSGRVDALVSDGETGRGIPNAIVFVGDQAVMTDAGGRAAFVNLSPRSYTLRVDRSSLPAGRVSNADEGFRVTVTSDRATLVPITVSRSGMISGTVLRFDFPQRTRLEDSIATDPVLTGGVGGFVVEATNGIVTHRRNTDREGRFEFNHLQPGSWTVRVAHGTIPALHSLKEDAIVLNLSGGVSEAVAFYIMPRRRTIRMIDLH